MMNLVLYFIGIVLFISSIITLGASAITHFKETKYGEYTTPMYMTSCGMTAVFYLIMFII